MGIVSLVEVVGISSVWQHLPAFGRRVDRHDHELLVVALSSSTVAWVLRHDIVWAVVVPVVVEDGLHSLELLIVGDYQRIRVLIVDLEDSRSEHGFLGSQKSVARG